MTRDEMLEKLHNVSPGTQLTWLSSENAWECKYITPVGTGVKWIGQNDWPAFELHDITKTIVDTVKDKLHKGILVADDLRETELLKLWEEYSQSYHQEESPLDLCSFLSGIKIIASTEDGTIYSIVDYSGESKAPAYFTDYMSFEKAFATLIEADSAWEELSDEELAAWIDDMDEFEGITCMTFSDTDE